jgi:hypothetical protein
VAQQLATQGHNDQIRGLGAVQSAPCRIGFNCPVQRAMTGATKRDEVVTQFMTQSGIAAMVQVATLQRPNRPTDHTAGFDAAASRPVSRPLFPQREPPRAGHVVAIDATPANSADGPDKTGAGITHWTTNFRWRPNESHLRQLPGRVGGAARQSGRSMVGA